MKRMVGWSVGALMTIGSGLALADDLVVVELYTSQGCSSCPPADALVADLSAQAGVLVLALHVDYWDYIGWKDNFANPAFTQRQKAYAHVAGARTIYTPQMVVAGKDHLVGTHEAELSSLIEMHAQVDKPVDLSLTRVGDRIVVQATGSAEGPLVVQLVRFVPEETVSIGRGENAGRTITYHNIVTDWQEIGVWDGQAPLSMESQLTGTDPAAVILQEPGPGRIVAAARLN